MQEFDSINLNGFMVVSDFCRPPEGSISQVGYICETIDGALRRNIIAYGFAMYKNHQFLLMPDRLTVVDAKIWRPANLPFLLNGKGEHLVTKDLFSPELLKKLVGI